RRDPGLRVVLIQKDVAAQKLQTRLFDSRSRGDGVGKLALHVAKAGLETIEAQFFDLPQYFQEVVEIVRVDPPGVALPAQLDAAVLRGGSQKRGGRGDR